MCRSVLPSRKIRIKTMDVTAPRTMCAFVRRVGVPWRLDLDAASSSAAVAQREERRTGFMMRWLVGFERWVNDLRRSIEKMVERGGV